MSIFVKKIKNEVCLYLNVCWIANVIVMHTIWCCRSKVRQENPPIIVFEETEHDFGKLAKDEIVEHVFKFKNEGKSPLIIADAIASCGCTVPEIPKEPIQPGKEGEIKVVFNSAYKIGEVTKTIKVSANTYPERITKITIKAQLPE